MDRTFNILFRCFIASTILFCVWIIFGFLALGGVFGYIISEYLLGRIFFLLFAIEMLICLLMMFSGVGKIRHIKKPPL